VRATLSLVQTSLIARLDTTEKARSLNATFDEVSEIFIRELEFSRILFKLNEADKESNEDVIAEAQFDMDDFMEMALDKKTEITLRSTRGNERNTIQLTAQYIPVEIKLEARESVNSSSRLAYPRNL
jgi:Ca2+-dependent lipid-binding protein